MRPRPLISPIFIMLALLHAYVAVRLLPALGFYEQIVAAAMLGASLWLMPKGFHLRERAGRWAALVPWLAMGFFSWLLVLTLARDLSLAVSTLLLAPPARGEWLRASAIAVLVATPVITAIGFFMARRVAPVVKVDVPLAGLPAALEGFTIAQISDIHVGTTTSATSCRRSSIA